MKYVFYAIAFFLISIWAISFFAYSVKGIVYIFPLLAIVAIALNFNRNKKPIEIIYIKEIKNSVALVKPTGVFEHVKSS